MSFSWNYPIYLLPHDRGYASLVDQNGEQPVHSLIVCTEPQLGIELMGQFSLLGAPRALRSPREFRWLLQSLKAPVTSVAFDPNPTDHAINAEWQATVSDLLTRHLPNDLSPWDYPIFAVGQERGFACIEATSDAAAAMQALGIFTSAEKAEAYLRDAEQEGSLLELTDLEMTVTFLSALQAEIAAVAIDPKIVGGQHRTEHCLGIDVLLTKYLVSEPS